MVVVKPVYHRSKSVGANLLLSRLALDFGNGVIDKGSESLLRLSHGDPADVIIGALSVHPAKYLSICILRVSKIGCKEVKQVPTVVTCTSSVDSTRLSTSKAQS